VSQENVEVVRELYLRVLNGERPPLPGLWHEDAEWYAPGDPDGTVVRGLPAITQAFRDWEEAYPDIRAEPLELTAGSGDDVFVWVRVTGHGARSGVPAENEQALIWTIRDGKALRVVEYTDRSEALKAVGLEE
jgi:ketosteroid isomerase-like protein